MLDVRIEKIVPNGLGLAFGENLTLFVPLSAVGDRVRVRVNQIKGKTAFAEIIEVIESSKDRVKPPCVYFGTCGGCDFQQMSYTAQLEAKVGIVRDCLLRIGRIDFAGEIPIIASPKELNYRLRAQWHYNVDTNEIGYFKRQTHQIINAETCPILVPELESLLQTLRASLKEEVFFEPLVKIETAAGKNGVSVFSEELLMPTEEIFFQINGKKYFFNAKSFFQGNVFLVEDLVTAAIEGAKGKTALDLFCGVGLFSLALANNFEKVIGVEENPSAIEFANKNAAINHLNNAEFYDVRVKDFLSENDLSEIDFILLDPPRSGIKQGTLTKITRLKAEKIVYVSCNPSTLARDLQILLDSQYEIESITAFDLFPQTHHVETIIKLNLIK